MKKLLFACFLVAAILCIGVECYAETGDAQTHRNMYPTTDNTYDIGSTTLRWKTINVYDITINDDLAVTDDLSAADATITGDLSVGDDAAISKINFGSCTDTGDVTFTVTFTLTPTIVTGTIISFIASTPNATGAADLIIASTTYNLKSLHNASPAANYIESGSYVLVGFDGTYMQILTPDANP